MRKQEESPNHSEPKQRKTFAAAIDRELLLGPIAKSQNAYSAQFNEIAARSQTFAKEWVACTEGMSSHPVVVINGSREIKADELDPLLHISPNNREKAQNLSEELVSVIKLCDAQRDEAAVIKQGDSSAELKEKNGIREAIYKKFFPTSEVHGYSLGVLMEYQKFADEALSKIAHLNDSEVVIKGEMQEITAKELRDIISGDNPSMAYDNVKKIKAMRNPEVHPSVELGAVLKQYEKKNEIEVRINDQTAAHRRPHQEKMASLSKKDILSEIESLIDPHKLKEALPKSKTVQKMTPAGVPIQIMLKQAAETAKSKIIENNDQLAAHKANGNDYGVLVCQLESAKLNATVKGISDIRTHLKLHPFELRATLKETKLADNSRRSSVRLPTQAEATPPVSRRTSISDDAKFKWEDTRRDSLDAEDSKAVVPASQSRHRLSSRQPSSLPTVHASAGESPRVSWAASRSNAAGQGQTATSDKATTEKLEESRSRSSSFSARK